MNNNFKITLKIVLIGFIIFHLPLSHIYSETIVNVAASLLPIETKKSNGKSIYIYNTHQGEKYETKSVKEGSRYLMQLLKQRGYDVNYETNDFELYKVKNKIDYAYSYTVSQKYLKSEIVQHGSYDLVIDFHRDSIPKSLSTVTIDGKDYAKLMFVVGKGSSNYKDVKKRCDYLSDQLNQKIPQLSRGVMVKQSHYNQGITKNMLLIEVGANENTYEEVKNSLNILSLVIDEYLSQ